MVGLEDQLPLTPLAQVLQQRGSQQTSHSLLTPHLPQQAHRFPKSIPEVTQRTHTFTHTQIRHNAKAHSVPRALPVTQLCSRSGSGLGQ